MTNPFIVGLTGKAGCGKDTAAAALLRELSFVQMALADPIKDALCAMMKWPRERWNDRIWKEQELDYLRASPRKLAQTLGTEWGRSIHPDFWIRVLSNRITQTDGSPIVVTDVRFDNEAKWIQSQGGWVIEIFRDGIEAVNSHSSESGIHPNLIDYTIANNDTIEVLQQRVVREVADKFNTYEQNTHI